MQIDKLRNICLSFPAVTEDVKWETNLCFCVGSKMFCIANLEPPHTFSFKVKEEEYEDLIQADGFLPAPYLARSNWILVADSSKLSRVDLKNYLHQSYELIKAKIPRKLRTELGLS